jgi:hypothetical protein
MTSASGTGGAPYRGHAFVSYVREDAGEVDMLERALIAAGVPVWRDTANLWPGEDWRAKVRDAITHDALVFIACFSSRSAARQKSYQREELWLAIEQLRLRRPDDPWLIPVRFDDCDVLDLELGGGRTLASIQRADLFGQGRDQATRRLVAAVQQLLRKPASPAGETSGPLAGDTSEGAPKRAAANVSERQLDALRHGEHGDWEPAVRLLRGVLEEQIRTLGPDHRNTLFTRQLLVLATGGAGDPREATAMLNGLLAKQTHILGASHEDTLRSQQFLAVNLEEAGYRERAAAIMRMLVPGSIAAKRGRRERRIEATREACINLLRAVGELRTEVANILSYRGDRAGMAARLATVREYAQSSQLNAVAVALLSPEGLAVAAERLAASASGLADATARLTDLDQGVLVEAPEFSELDESVANFRLVARAWATGNRRESRPEATREACISLLGAAGDLRTHIINLRHYRGPDIAARLAEIRIAAASAEVHAAGVELLSSETLAEAAELLAAEVNRTARATEEDVDLWAGVVIDSPDLNELDRSIAEFREAALAEARG